MATRDKVSVGDKPKGRGQGHASDYYLRKRPDQPDDDTWEFVDDADLGGGKPKLTSDDKSLPTPPANRPHTIEQVNGSHTQKSTALSEALREKRLLQEKLDERLIRIAELEQQNEDQQKEIAQLCLQMTLSSDPSSDFSSGAYHTPVTSLNENQQTDTDGRISLLQRDIQAKTKQIEEQCVEIVRKDEKILELQQKFDQQRKAAPQGGFGKTQDDVLRLMQELSAHQEENRKLKQEINQLKRRFDHAVGLEEQLTQLTITVSTLEEEKKELQKQLQLGAPVGQPEVGTHDHTYQQKLRGEIERLRPLKERSKALEQQLKAAQRYEKEYHEAIDENMQLKAEIVSLKAEMREQVIPRADDMSDPKDEASKLKAQVKAKNQAMSKLQAELKASQEVVKELNRVTEHSKKQSREVMYLKQEKAALKAGEEEHSEYEQSLIDSVRNLEDENRKLLDELQGANRDRGSLKEALEAATTSKKELVTRVQLLEAQVEGISPKEESARKQLQSLSDSYRMMQQQNQKMKVENQKLLTQIEKLSTLSEENANLKLQIGDLNDQISLLTQLKSDILGDLEAAKAEALIYKEDFEKERRDRAEAFGKMDDLRKQHDEEVPVLKEDVECLQRELITHQQRLEEVELVAQKREKHAVKVVQELDKAQEEVRAKTSQVKQYKKQVDQLKAQVTEAEGNNVRLIEAMSAVRSELVKSKQDKEKLSKEIQKFTKENQKVAKRKKSDRSLASPEQPMSLPIQTESQLAKTESLFEKERSENEALRADLLKALTERNELYQENSQLKQRLESPSTPPLPPRTSKASDVGKRSAAVSPLGSPMEGHAIPQVVGQLDAEHQALHSQEKIKQQLQHQFSQQQESGSRRAKTEILSVGSGGFVATQPEPLTAGEGLPAALQPQTVGGGGIGIAPQTAQPVLRAAVGPHSQSSAGRQPPATYPQAQEVYRQRSHSDTEPRPILTHQPVPQEYPPGQSYEMGELHHGVDTAIHQVAEGVISAVDDESSRRLVTQKHIPYDPNLTCPYCEKQFRMGEIQKYRHHVKSCTGTGTDTVGTVV